MGDARAFVAEAYVVLNAQVDPAAVGAAVMVELCGEWEHEGPCRWPHSDEIRPGPELATFRTLVVAEASEEQIVRGRMVAALRGSGESQAASVRAPGRPTRAGAGHEASRRPSRDRASLALDERRLSATRPTVHPQPPGVRCQRL